MRPERESATAIRVVHTMPLRGRGCQSAATDSLTRPRHCCICVKRWTTDGAMPFRPRDNLNQPCNPGGMGPRWECRIDGAQHLVLALYTRDAGQLQPLAEPQVADLQPSVPARRDLLPEADRAAATAQWERWWELLWTAREDMLLTSGLPDEIRGLGEQRELLTLIQAIFYEAMEYCTAREHELSASTHSGPPQQAPEVGMVKAAMRRRGLTRPSPVKLQVSELPARTAQAWHRWSGDIVVTRPLRRDAVRYQRWLKPIVAELARPTQQANG